MICRVCDSTRLELVLDLGNQPWCNHFLKPEEVGTEPYYPLRLVYCTRLLDCPARLHRQEGGDVRRPHLSLRA